MQMPIFKRFRQLIFPAKKRATIAEQEAARKEQNAERNESERINCAERDVHADSIVDESLPVNVVASPASPFVGRNESVQSMNASPCSRRAQRRTHTRFLPAPGRTEYANHR